MLQLTRKQKEQLNWDILHKNHKIVVQKHKSGTEMYLYHILKWIWPVFTENKLKIDRTKKKIDKFKKSPKFP